MTSWKVKVTVCFGFRDIMKQAVLDKSVLAMLKIDKMLERLRKNNELLELIQKVQNLANILLLFVSVARFSLSVSGCRD